MWQATAVMRQMAREAEQAVEDPDKEFLAEDEEEGKKKRKGGKGKGRGRGAKGAGKSKGKGKRSGGAGKGKAKQPKTSPKDSLQTDAIAMEQETMKYLFDQGKAKDADRKNESAETEQPERLDRKKTAMIWDDSQNPSWSPSPQKREKQSPKFRRAASKKLQILKKARRQPGPKSVPAATNQPKRKSVKRNLEPELDTPPDESKEKGSKQPPCKEAPKRKRAKPDDLGHLKEWLSC